MSTKTRREKRKATAAQPVETDWLWSCPPLMPLGDIAQRLGFESEPRTELSARTWGDERRMRDDLYWALVPNSSVDRLAPHVVWDALAEHVLTACLDGRLIVLRGLPSEVPHVPSAVQMLIHIVGGRDPGIHSVRSPRGAHVALVLEGWPAKTIRVRSSSTTHYIVQALGGRAGASSASEPYHDGGQGLHREVACGELLVPRGDATELLEAIDEPLHLIPLALLWHYRCSASVAPLAGPG